MSLITKREIEQLPQNENNYQLILSFLDSNKNNSSQRFFLKKSKFVESFGKDNNGYYPLFYYIVEIPESSNYYICNSFKPKIILIPFIGEYSFILPDYSQSIIPNYIHINWEEENQEVFEIAYRQLCFSEKK